ncbi:hypothetical protein MMPV_009551 [Pyropia vietnamensis]
MAAAFVPATAAAGVVGVVHAAPPLCGRAARRVAATPTFVAVPAPRRCRRTCRMGVHPPLASAAAAAAAAVAATAPGAPLGTVAAVPSPGAIPWSTLYMLAADVGSTAGGVDVQALGLVAAIAAGALLAAVVAFVIIKV